MSTLAEETNAVKNLFGYMQYRGPSSLIFQKNIFDALQREEPNYTNEPPFSLQDTLILHLILLAEFWGALYYWKLPNQPSSTSCRL